MPPPRRADLVEFIFIYISEAVVGDSLITTIALCIFSAYNNANATYTLGIMYTCSYVVHRRGP
jgi:hypothetical protein